MDILILVKRMKKFVKTLEKQFSLNGDYIFKEIKLGRKWIYFAFNEVLTSSTYVNDFILKRITKIKPQDFYNLMNVLPDANMKEITKEEVIYYMHQGFIIIFSGNIIAIEAKASLDRGVSAIESELSIKGPKDAFSENFNTNLRLIRRRIKSEHLIAERREIGRSTKTSIGILYMNDIIDNGLLEQVKKNLETIDIDGIMDATYLRENLEAHKTFFPTISSTERPDKVAMALLEGKIAIIVDMSPYVLIMPTFLIDYFHTVDDYYQKPINISFIRIIRLLAFLMAIFTPAFYLAVTTHDFDMIPLNLLLSLKAQRESVPFPALIEAMLMSISFEVLRESDIRMSSTTGSAVSILGGLILGDAAVSAGIISPIMIIVIAISAISGLVFPSIELVSAIRWWRFIMMILATMFGVWGILIGTIILFIRLYSLKSLGKPYLYPFLPFNKLEQKDAIIKVNNRGEKYRNPLLTKNRKRGFYR